MPTIALGSSKGGCGKTTVSLVLASTLANRGYKVGMLESDSAGNLMAWRATFEHFGTPPTNIRVRPLNETMPAADVDYAAKAMDYLIIDLGGGLSPIFRPLLRQIDTIIIPMMVAPMDMSGAIRTFDFLKSLAADEGHAPPRTMVTISNYDPIINAREMPRVERILAKSGLSLLEEKLIKRRMYSIMQRLPCSLHGVDQDMRNEAWAKAIENAEKFTNAVMERLA